MRNMIIMVIAAVLFTGVFQVCSASEHKEFSTPGFKATLEYESLCLSILDKNEKNILQHEENGCMYALVGGEKHFLSRCSQESVDGLKTTLECEAGSETFSVDFELINDYELSLIVSAPEGTKAEKIGHRFLLPRYESIYGLKEHVEGDGKAGTDLGSVQNYATLDQRGSTVEMYTRPTISIYSPFHINSGGYGLFFDTSWPGIYDLGDTDAEVADIQFEGQTLPMYFTYGPGMPEIIERHTDRVGKSLLPPKWASLVFKWRDDHINLPVLYDNTMNPSPFNSMVYEDIMMLRKLDIPTGVYWLDRPWAKGKFGYDDFEFDELRFPKPGEMIKWLKEKNGMETLLWVAPWAYGKMREVAAEKGYLAPTSPTVIDLTNPEAVEWWQDEFHKMFDLGVGGFKLDRCEEIIPSGTDHIYHNGKTGRELHNLYPLLYAKAVQGACQKFRGNDCLVMPRSGFTGSQKYAVFWGGDTHPSWRGLRSAVISCLRSGLMGFPVWGSDTGGYGVSETQDLFSRWMQVSAFHPIMEVGGSGSHEPWNAGYEPKYDQVGIDNYRFYAKLHTELAPYNYSYMYQSHEKGLPIVRPLVYHWPEDLRVRDLWDEFMFGDWLLAAPVMTQGAREREVYLPEGKWYDFWNDRNVLSGPKNFLVSAPIEKMPIFIRAGAIIPLNILDTETGFGKEFAAGKFVIAMYPDERESSLTYYDGENAAELRARDAGAKVELDTTGITVPIMLKVRTKKPEAVAQDGAGLERYRKVEEFTAAETGWYWEPKEQLLWIKMQSGGKLVIDKKIFD